MGAVKEKLETEWETVKFMGQEENMELRDKMEDLEEAIMEEQVDQSDDTFCHKYRYSSVHKYILK